MCDGNLMLFTPAFDDMLLVFNGIWSFFFSNRESDIAYGIGKQGVNECCIFEFPALPGHGSLPLSNDKGCGANHSL